MTKRGQNPVHQGRDGKHSYTPTIEITPRERQYLSDQLDKLSTYKAEVNYLKSLPVVTRTEIHESTRWITSGIRHADGHKIRTRHVRNDLPSEGELLIKAYGYAKAVDELIERCKAHPAAGGQRRGQSLDQA